MPHICHLVKSTFEGTLVTGRANLYNSGLRFDLQCMSHGAFTDAQLSAIQERIWGLLEEQINNSFVTKFNSLPFVMEVLIPDTIEMIVAEMCALSEDQALLYFKRYRQYEDKRETQAIIGNLS